MHGEHWDALELGPFEAQGCSRNAGNPENRWDDRELWKHQDPWGYRDAPGALGRLGAEGAPGWSGMQRDGAGCAGSLGMRRCGLKAPPRGSQGELPGEARDPRESPGTRAGPRRRDTERPSIPGNTGRREFRDGTRLSLSPQPPGTGRGRIPAHFPWERQQRGPPSAQSHQPSRKNPERRRDAGMLGRLDVNAWNVISGHGPG